jgi:hypothetical protein
MFIKEYPGKQRGIRQTDWQTDYFTSTITINFKKLWRHPHAQQFACGRLNKTRLSRADMKQ